MRTVRDMTPAQIRDVAHEAIIREMGVTGLIRYLQDQSLGSGNYVQDRWKWLPKYESVDQLWDDMEPALKDIRERSGKA